MQSKRLRVLNYSVGYISWSFAISVPILEVLRLYLIVSDEACLAETNLSGLQYFF